MPGKIKSFLDQYETETAPDRVSSFLDKYETNQTNRPREDITDVPGSVVDSLGPIARKMGAGVRGHFETVEPGLPRGELGRALDEKMGVVRPPRKEVTPETKALMAEAEKDLREAAPQNPTFMGELAYDISVGLVQMAPTLAIAFATRGAGTGTAMTAGLTPMAAQVGSTEFTDATLKGRNSQQAHQDASFAVMSEVIPEIIPLGYLMKPGKKFLPRLLATAGLEGAEEVMTEALQIGYDTGVLKEDMTWGEAVKRMGYAGLVGAGMGGGMAAGSQPFVDSDAKAVGREMLGAVDDAQFQGTAEEAARDIFSNTIRTESTVPGMAPPEPTGYQPTQSDIDSLVPTQVIKEGHDEITKLLAESDVDEILERNALPGIGSRVELDLGGGNRRIGTIEDAFHQASEALGIADDGIRIRFDDGSSFEDMLGTIKSSGGRIIPHTTPTAAVDGPAAVALGPTTVEPAGPAVLPQAEVAGSPSPASGVGQRNQPLRQDDMFGGPSKMEADTILDERAVNTYDRLREEGMSDEEIIERAEQEIDYAYTHGKRDHFEEFARVATRLNKRPIAEYRNEYGFTDGSPASPIEVKTAADLDKARQVVAAPTEGQKEAGNYRKAHVTFQGLDIAIETGKGQERAGTAPDGTEWYVDMPADYGYVKKSEGADGDQVDVYLGPKPDADTVYMVDQYDLETQSFDEHKAMLGFASQKEAEKAYDAAFSDGKGPQRRVDITPMSMEQFKAWLKSGNTKLPAADSQAAKAVSPAAQAPAGAQGAQGVATTPIVMEPPATVAPGAGGTADIAKRFTARGFRPELAEKNAKRLAATIESGKYDDILHPDNRNARAIYEEVTGKKLPKGADATRNFFKAAEPAGPRVIINKVGKDGLTDAERAAKKPEPAKEKYKLLGKNADGENVYEDDNGVRSVTMAGGGIRVNESVELRPTRSGYESATKRDADGEPTDKRFRVAKPKKGKAFSARMYHGTGTEFDGPFKGVTYFTYSEKEARGYAKERGRNSGVAKVITADVTLENPATSDDVEAAVEALGLEVETSLAAMAAWPEVMAELKQRGFDGIVDVLDFGWNSDFGEFPVVAVFDPSSAKRVDEPKTSAPAAGPPPASAAAPPQAQPAPRTTGYGENNKLVSKERADELRAKLRRKFKTQLNEGLDPEILAAGAELAVYHLEAGARKFRDVVQALIDDLGVSLQQLRPYMRGIYNGARDMMEDAGQSIDGMDTAEQVRTELVNIDKEIERGLSGTVSPGSTGAGSRGVPSDEAGGDAGRTPETKDAGSRAPVQGTDEGRAETPERGGARAVQPGSTAAGEGQSDSVPATGTGRGTSRGARRAADRPDGVVTGENHVILPGSLGETRGFKTKARDNIAAIRTMLQVEAEARPATKTEQEILAKYVGWGGIKGAFPDGKGEFGEGYADIGAELQELLSEEEYATARRSIQYAHYTSETIVRSMWDLAARLGFKGGLVFEPGMGIGNFAGMMPQDIAKASQYAGIEFDATTARIAKLLYPNWGVRHEDYTKTELMPDTFDLVIGNPPFADIAIKSDPKYAKHGFLLHDYFFAKSLDSVRPGGLLIFISSAGTMNKLDTSAREYMAERADFVGAIRLPGDAFEKNAGTSVTTDIIVLRKKSETAPPIASPPWVEAAEVTLPTKDGGTKTGASSSYFVANPDMVLGEEGFWDKLYPERYAVRSSGGTLAPKLEAAVATFPQDIMGVAEGPADRAKIDFTADERKEGSYYIGADGKLMQFSGGAGREVERRGKGVTGGKTADELKRIRALIPVRDALRDTFAADLAGNKDAGDKARAKLNAAYDKFTAEFGPINKAVVSFQRPSVIEQENARAEAREEARYAGGVFEEGTFDASAMIAEGKSLSEIARARRQAREDAKAAGRTFDEGTFDPADMADKAIVRRPNIDPFMDDQESYRLRSIEEYNESDNTAQKRAIFFENIITKERSPEIKGVGDAVLHVLNKIGRFDIAEVAKAAELTESETIEKLGEKIFKVPGTFNTWVTSDEYLSGDVRAKLLEAKAAAERDPDFKRNVDALEAAKPIDLETSEIYAHLGMPWIPTKVVEQFSREIGLRQVQVRYEPKLATWFVVGDHSSAAATSEWGTPRRSGVELLSDALNRTDPKIYDIIKSPGEPEQRILNTVDTQAAQDKMNAIKDRFREWIWSDETRATELARFYNDTYNNLVVREYDGSFLTTPGIASHWSWRPHQKNVVARIILNGSTYMAHAVGAGKTSAMIGAGMEMRRLGLVRKPMYAVPNHMLGQFTKEFYEQYPTARIMVADERRFHTDRRKQFMAEVALSDIDAVIITHSSFGKIPISDAFKDDLIQAEIDEYRDLLESLDKSDANYRITRSRVEKQIERFEQRLSGRSGAGRKDQVFTFEEMGVDFLFVDEAHLFRKLDFATKMSGLKGVSPEGSQMSWDLYVKSRYLETKNPGRNLVLASGTPITNTMAELYSLSRYIQPQALAARGLGQFDAWAGAFGTTKTGLEPNAGGGYEAVSRFAEFVNVAELSKMVRQTMDVVTSKQLEQYVTLPVIRGGRTLHLIEATEEFKRYQQGLAARMTAIKNRRGKPKKGDDIVLTVINDGRHAAIDTRLVGMEPSGPTKLTDLIENVARIYKETTKQPLHRPEKGGYSKDPVTRGPATQMIFANLGIGDARPMNVVKYIRAELQARGVPKSQIAYIADYGSHVEKQRLFNDMNEGKVRILIGSTAKMATGVNAQRRLYAVHNLDPLWYPADDEQRNGRAKRQGNMNPEIEIHDYGTKGSYDEQMWKMMGRKAGFIEGFFNGDPSMRVMEDLGEASAYEQAAAMTSANPILIELTEAKAELEKAERRKSAFDQQKSRDRARIGQARGDLDYYTRRREGVEKDIEQRTETKGDEFKGTVGKTQYTKRAEFDEALKAVADELTMKGGNFKDRPIAQVGGFNVLLTVTHEKKGYYRHISIDRNNDWNQTLGGMSAQSIEAALRGFEANLESIEQSIAKAQRDIAEFTPKLDTQFTGMPEIIRLTEKVRELEQAMTAAAVVPPAVEAVPVDGAGNLDLDGNGPMGLSDELMAGISRRAFLGAAAGAPFAFAAKGQTAEMADYLRAKTATVKGALETIATTSQDDGRRTLARLLLPKIPTDIKLRVHKHVDDRTWEKLPDVLKGAYGAVYVTPEGKIELLLRDDKDPRLSGLNEDTVLHEAIHAAVLHGMGRFKDKADIIPTRFSRGERAPADDLERAVVDLFQVRSELIYRINGGTKEAREAFLDSSYGPSLGSPEEFITYALTNKEFQDWLKTQPYGTRVVETETGDTLWDRIVAAIRRFFFGDTKVPVTALEAVLDASNRVVENLAPGMGKPAPSSDPSLYRMAIPVKFDNAATEERFKKAKGGVASADSFIDRITDGWDYAKAAMTRHYIDLPNTQGFADVKEQLRKLEAAPSAAKEDIVRLLRSLTKGMTPADLDLFTRKVILDDLAWEASQDHDLPFGLTAADIPRELAKVDNALTPALVSKVRERKLIIRRIAQDLVDAGVLKAEQIRNPTYYRHQVLDYARAQVAMSGDGRLRTPKWAKRMGSKLDINANLLEAEFDWLHKALTDIKTAETIEWIKESPLNLREDLIAQAKAANTANLNQAIADDIQANGFMKNGRLTSPLNEALVKLNQEIAMGISFVKTALQSGVTVPAEWQQVAQDLANDIDNPNTMRFLTWMIDNNIPGSSGAGLVFKGIAGRKLFSQNVLGDKYVDTMDTKAVAERFAPDGYTTWQPDEGKMFFTAKTLPEHVIDRMLDKVGAAMAQGAGGLPIMDVIEAMNRVRPMLAIGGDKYTMVIPEELAATLNKLRTNDTDPLVNALLEKPLRYWKAWVLINPRRVIKYNINNLSGDLDATIAGQPSVLKKMPQAMKELFDVMYRGKKPTAQYQDAVERGVFDSGLTIQEIPDINLLSEFEPLMEGRSKANPLTWPGRVWDQLKKATQFRENWVRYAAYLRYVERLERGDTMADIGYGASFKPQVDGVTDTKDKAALLARGLVGDYGDISHWGQLLRRRAFPFWSFKEINARRYWRLTRNAYGDGVGKGLAVGTFLGVTKGAALTASLYLRMFTLYALVSLWNNLFFPDEEDELSEQERTQLHLNLGRTDDGEVRTLRLQGALSDVLAWGGFEDVMAMMNDVERGRASVGDMLKTVAKAPFNVLAQGFNPFAKGTTELLAGVKFFPDAFNPRGIRDRWRHITEIFGVQNEYDLMTGSPSRGYGRSLEEAVTYKRDVGEEAYNDIQNVVHKWLKKEKGQEGFTALSTPRSDALYNWRRALRYGDKQAATAARQQLRDLRVSERDIIAALKRAHPLASVPIKDRARFLKTLDPQERKAVDSAIAWYQETFIQGARK